MAILDFLGKKGDDDKQEETSSPKSSDIKEPIKETTSTNEDVSQTDVVEQSSLEPQLNVPSSVNVEIPEDTESQTGQTDQQTKEETAKTAKNEANLLLRNKVYGPLMAPFAGKQIRKFYLGGKWYFCIEELLALLSADPHLKTFPELKNEAQLKELFQKNLKNVNDVECADGKGAMEILRAVIKTYNAQFPGSLFSWLEDISKFSFEFSNGDPEEIGEVPLVNPSDRGV